MLALIFTVAFVALAVFILLGPLAASKTPQNPGPRKRERLQEPPQEKLREPSQEEAILALYEKGSPNRQFRIELDYSIGSPIGVLPGISKSFSAQVFSYPENDLIEIFPYLILSARSKPISAEREIELMILKVHAKLENEQLKNTYSKELDRVADQRFGSDEEVEWTY